MTRKAVPNSIQIKVLTEAGYRCAVPTCRSILAIDIHHMVEVSKGGGNDHGNLLALCPTCHALFHRGEIVQDSIYAWKSMLVSLNYAFDTATIDDLLFLSKLEGNDNLRISGDGVLKFSRLIGNGLAEFTLFMQNGPLLLYRVSLSERGRNIISAWLTGNRRAVEEILGEYKLSQTKD